MSFKFSLVGRGVIVPLYWVGLFLGCRNRFKHLLMLLFVLPNFPGTLTGVWTLGWRGKEWVLQDIFGCLHFGSTSSENDGDHQVFLVAGIFTCPWEGPVRVLLVKSRARFPLLPLYGYGMVVTCTPCGGVFLTGLEWWWNLWQALCCCFLLLSDSR